MATDLQNFWPADLIDEGVVPPVTILREAAGELSKRTKGILRGEVAPMGSKFADSPALFFRLRIVAPALDNYKFEILRLQQKSATEMYPVELSGTALKGKDAIRHRKADNEQELRDTLRFALGSEATKQIVSALLSQSKAAME